MKKEIKDIKPWTNGPFTPEDEYVEYLNDMQSQVQKDLEEASASGWEEATWAD